MKEIRNILAIVVLVLAIIALLPYARRVLAAVGAGATVNQVGGYSGGQPAVIQLIPPSPQTEQTFDHAGPVEVVPDWALATAVPAPAAPAAEQGAAFSPSFGEACRQAAVAGRRGHPDCRAYFEQLGAGR